MPETAKEMKWDYALRTIGPRITAVRDSFGRNGYDHNRLIELYSTCQVAFDMMTAPKDMKLKNRSKLK